jgi:hypothetical protein
VVAQIRFALATEFCTKHISPQLQLGALCECSLVRQVCLQQERVI